MTFLEKETPYSIAGPVGQLEAVISRPITDEVSTIAIVCHPHPLYGGTMNNKVVTTLVRTFVNLGMWSVRFNFRGIGKSEGEYANAIGEVDDLLAVIAWAQKEFPNKKICLAGFSFGSYVAARASAHETVRKSLAVLISVAPPVNNFDFASIPTPDCPWIVVQGDQDEVVPSAQVFAWIETLQPQPELICIKASSHFFHSRLVELQERLTKVLVNKLN